MTIPRVLHQTWKRNQVPAVWQPLAASWRRCFPDWEYRLWTDADNRELVASRYPWFLPTYDAYPENIMRVDAARYFMLHRFGGVYADLDYECLRRFDDVLEGRELLLGWEPAAHVSWWARERGLDRILGNALLASTPRHPFWRHLFRILVESRNRDNAVEATGPFLLTRAYESYQSRERLTVLEPDLIYPLDKEACWSGGRDDSALWGRISDRAIGIHHWDGTWWRRPEELRESLSDRVHREDRACSGRSSRPVPEDSGCTSPSRGLRSAGPSRFQNASTSGGNSMADGTFKAQVWVSRGRSYNFGERDPKIGVKNDTGICLSGGGTRALSAGAGQLRGLNMLGLIDKIDYISCVSGGSWLACAYTYYQSGPTDDAQFLGPQTGPSGTTFAWLGQLDEKSVGFTATQNLTAAISTLFLSHKIFGRPPANRVWIDAVGIIYLAQFGLFGHFADEPAFFSYDQATVNDIKRRNPQLQDATFYTVRTGPPRPYLIVNSAFATPTDITPPPFSTETLVGMEYTPLYVGNPFRRSYNFPNFEGPDVPVELGGGFLEPFAYGGAAPQGAPTGPPTASFVEVPATGAGMPFRLADATGTSSSAFVADAEELQVGEFSPMSPYWPVAPTGGQKTTDFNFADGGNLENYGLIALLLRQVKNIVVFINTSTKLKQFDPAHLPPKLQDFIDSDLPPLFGIAAGNSNMSRNQVFPTQDFKTVAQGLLDARFPASGPNGTVMTQTSHDVLDNDWWGTVPYPNQTKVNVLWVYNDRVTAWEKDLPPDVAQAIRNGNASPPTGPFPLFPNYKTVFPNGAPDLVELTKEQVNLLAALSAHNVLSNKGTFTTFLSATATTGEEAYD